jgi:hypothetical protein
VFDKGVITTFGHFMTSDFTRIYQGQLSRDVNDFTDSGFFVKCWDDRLDTCAAALCGERGAAAADVQYRGARKEGAARKASRRVFR